MPKVLVIEDERKVARFIQKGLSAEGMETSIAETGDQGLRMAMERDFDIITMDLSLPGIDGISAIRTLREKKNPACILILSARGALKDKLLGFDVGADDYLPKPFAFEELVVRIRALLRRKEIFSENLKLVYSDLEMDLSTHQVKRGGIPIELTSREFQLLELFLRNPERILSRAKIGETVWSEQFDRETNVIEVYMMYLRKKVDGDKGIRLLHTVRGSGYKLSLGGI
jgi:DNA-binding response OmpR family regulator